MERERAIAVRWLFHYGFVAPTTGGPDVYVHQHDIENVTGWRQLTPGQVVSFVRAIDHRAGGKPCARCVRVEQGEGRRERETDHERAVEIR